MFEMTWIVVHVAIPKTNVKYTLRGLSLPFQLIHCSWSSQRNSIQKAERLFFYVSLVPLHPFSCAHSLAHLEILNPARKVIAWGAGCYSVASLKPPILRESKVVLSRLYILFIKMSTDRGNITCVLILPSTGKWKQLSGYRKCEHRNTLY